MLVKKSTITLKIILLLSILISTNSAKATENPITTKVVIASTAALMAFFDSLHYSVNNWVQKKSLVPHLVFDRISPEWAQESHKLPVDVKKSIFFRLMLPLILIANQNILRERESVQQAPLDSALLINIALKYRLISTKASSKSTTKFTEALRHDLLLRVNTLPPSLALVQAAEESGWGTSRFALQGNAFFGQWDSSGNGMIPKQQRKELGNYGVARFNSPLDCIAAYMLNINSHRAYSSLRLLRNKSSNISGYQLASTLNKYSERGQDYVDGLRQMIRYNQLEKIDSAVLSNQRYALQILVK